MTNDNTVADRDYAAVLEEVKRRGKHAEVAYVIKKGSGSLRNALDKVIIIDGEFASACILDRPLRVVSRSTVKDP